MGEVITAGLIGSIITIIIKAIIDFVSEGKRYKKELKKTVFQRKTDIVEKAMSWYQEALDTWSMMQMSFEEIDGNDNPVAFSKLYSSSSNAVKLFKETEIRLNPIYLYYDFSDIEAKYNSVKSMEYINYGLSMIVKLEQETRNCNTKEEYTRLQKQAIEIFHEMSKAIEDQKNVIIDIQSKLRIEYKKYME